MLHHIVEVLISYGPWGILLLSFIDSAGIPVSAGMDALIIFLAVKAPEKAWLGASLGVLGSAIGNLVLFAIARKGGERFAERTAARSHHPTRFRRWFDRYGLVTVFIPALVPIPLPLKFFVVSAGAFQMSVVSFMLVVLTARAIRYFGLAYLGVKLGRDSNAFLQRHAWALGGVALGLIVSLFLLIRLSEWFRRRRRSRSGYNGEWPRESQS